MGIGGDTACILEEILTHFPCLMKHACAAFGFQEGRPRLGTLPGRKNRDITSTQFFKNPFRLFGAGCNRLFAADITDASFLLFYAESSCREIGIWKILFDEPVDFKVGEKHASYPL